MRVILILTQVLFRAEEKQMLIDVAHSSEATVLEACSLAKKPVVNSHTGTSPRLRRIERYRREYRRCASLGKKLLTLSRSARGLQ